jgi:hypothetical protein
VKQGLQVLAALMILTALGYWIARACGMPGLA